MKEKYSARIGGTPFLIVILITALLIGLTVCDILIFGFKLKRIWIHIVDIAVVVLMVWLLVSSYYAIDDTFLYYANGPFKGRIKISKITQIEQKKFQIKYFPQGLSNRGLLISTSGSIQFFITPKEKERMIRHLLNQNKSIQSTLSINS